MNIYLSEEAKCRIREHVMAEAAAHDEQVEQLMIPEAFQRFRDNRQLQRIDE